MATLKGKENVFGNLKMSTVCDLETNGILTETIKLREVILPNFQTSTDGNPEREGRCVWKFKNLNRLTPRNR